MRSQQSARRGRAGLLILIDVRDLDRFIAAFRTEPV
jgi:hypothetical protein